MRGKTPLSEASQKAIAANLMNSCKTCMHEGAYEDAQQFAHNALEYLGAQSSQDEAHEANIFILINDYLLALNAPDKNALLKAIKTKIDELPKKDKIYNIHELDKINSVDLVRLIQQENNCYMLLRRLKLELAQSLIASTIEDLELSINTLLSAKSYIQATETLRHFVEQYESTFQDKSFTDNDRNNLFNSLFKIHHRIIECSFKDDLLDSTILHNIYQQIEKTQLLLTRFANDTQKAQYATEALKNDYLQRFWMRFNRELEHLQDSNQFDAICNFMDPSHPLLRSRDPELKQTILVKSINAARIVLYRKSTEEHYQTVENSKTYINEMTTHLQRYCTSLDTVYGQAKSTVLNKISAYLVVTKHLHTLRYKSSSVPSQIIQDNACIDKSLISLASYIKQQSQTILPKEEKLDDSEKEDGVFALYALAFSYAVLSDGAQNSSSYDYCIDQSLTQLQKAQQLARDVHIEQSLLDSINDLFSATLQKPCHAAMTYRIKFEVEKYEQAKKMNNSAELKLACEQLIATLCPATISQYSHVAIPSLAGLYRELGDIYSTSGDAAQAMTMYRTCLQLDKTDLKAAQSIEKLLDQARAKEGADRTDTKAIEFRLLTHRKHLRKTEIYHKIPPYLGPLFDAILKGDLTAYTLLKAGFDSDHSFYNIFSEYIHCHSKEELANTQINALFDLAMNIRSGIVTYPERHLRGEFVQRLMELAAARKFPLAIYRLGRFADERYNYDKAQSHYEEAAALDCGDAKLYLALSHRRKGRYDKARQLLQELLATRDLPPPEINKLKNYLAQIEFLESLSLKLVPQTPVNETAINKRAIFIDFDNTIMRSQDLPGTFYVMYKPEEGATSKHQDKAHQFYTGGQKEWRDIFEHLKKMGFLIGVCTARYKKSGEQCVLFRQFIADFGMYLTRELIIFTEGQDKYKPMQESCHQHGVSKRYAMLVDDTEKHVHNAIAVGFKAVHAANLVTNHGSFYSFKKHLLEVAAEIAKECKKASSDPLSDDDVSPDENDGPKAPATPSYSTPGSSSGVTQSPARVNLTRSLTMFTAPASNNAPNHGDSGTTSKRRNEDSTSERGQKAKHPRAELRPSGSHS